MTGILGSMNDRPLRIGLDARLVAYRAGGISSYVQQMVATLERIDPVHTYVIGESRKARAPLTSRFQRLTLWTPPHHRLESLALAAELLPHRLDVWHTTDFIPPYAGARRHVVSVHDLTFLVYPQFLTAASRHYYNGQIARAVRSADQILTISESSKRDIVARLGVPADRITVQWCGVNAEFTPQSPERCTTVRRELELPPRYLLFVGTYEPRKNVAGLVTAYAELAAQQPDLPPLVLAGQPGWLFEETQQQIDRLGLRQRVLFRQFRYDQLPALYTMAELLAFPSFYEGFGLPPLEAMACGTIPVVSDCSSLPEVVGDVGVRVNPHDPASIAAGLATALGDPVWRQQQQHAGRERARLFTWERTAQIARAVYEAAAR